MTTSPGKQLEIISKVHIGSSIYNSITSSRGSDDLPIGFDRDRVRRQCELTNNKK